MPYRYVRQVAGLLILCVLTIIAGSACDPASLPTIAHASASIRTSTATKTTPTPIGTVDTIFDASTASHLNIAYIFANNVWVRAKGADPRQVTHFPSGIASSDATWALSFSPDATRLAVQLTDASGSRAWLVTLPDDTVTEMPSLVPGQWFQDRYLAFPTASPASATKPCGAHDSAIGVYDTQTASVITTALSNVCTYSFQARGSAIYFATQASPTAHGTIQKFDLASNSISTAFDAPMPFYTQGVPDVSWDLSADASALVLSGQHVPGCTQTDGTCFASYQTGHDVTPLFDQLRTLASSGMCYSQAIISPDGRTAATVLSSVAVATCRNQVLQEAAPNGQQNTNALPTPATLVGFTSDSANILAQSVSDGTSQLTTLYLIPINSSQAATKIATIPSQFVIAGVSN